MEANGLVTDSRGFGGVVPPKIRRDETRRIGIRIRTATQTIAVITRRLITGARCSGLRT
jgi:hypothetical protein